MSELTKTLKEHAQTNGADLVGIAPIERFEGLAPECHPASIFPEVKSVIAIAKRITRGTLRGVEEGTQFGLYQQYGRDWLNNRVLAMAAFAAGELLEDHGFEAVPLPNLPPETPPLGIPVRPGQPAPNVMLDFDQAAVRAGLGQLCYSGFFLTREYGPRQRLQLVLTDAALTADPLVTEPISPAAHAEHAAFCPLGAISPDEADQISIDGCIMTVGRIDDEVCQRCPNGATKNPYHASGKADRLAALCARNLIVHLEENNCLSNRFQNPFRKRKPWGWMQETRSIEECE